jgi:hypothetical protein
MVAFTSARRASVEVSLVMKMFVVAAALAALVASPAFAQPTYNGYAPFNQLERPTVGPHGELHISAARAAAIRECSAIAAQYPEYEWGNMEIQQYRACMAVHGQVE